MPEKVVVFTTDKQVERYLNAENYKLTDQKLNAGKVNFV